MRTLRRVGLALALLVIACGTGEGAPSHSSAGSSGADSGAGGSVGGEGGGASGSAGMGGSSGGGAAAGNGGAGGGGGDAGSAGDVDPSTLANKHLLGYQGWFLCPGDGAPPDRWVHWFKGQTPAASELSVDMWPDLTELGPSELFDTLMTFQNGQPARLYSAFVQPTVVRHFAWMQSAGIDGVLLQRFVSELSDPSFLAFRDQVAENVRVGAEQHGRVFAMMYDISGADAASLQTTLADDWAYLVTQKQLTASPRYLRHDGKPVLAIWGLGFSDRPASAEQAAAIVEWFRSAAPAEQRVTLIGGVPSRWRSLTADSKTEPAWASVYRSFDVLSPWSVGRYADDAGADAFQAEVTIPDIAETKAHGIEYMPVVFPGFSWHNLHGGPLNQIPRKGGTFYWRQVYNGVSAGSSLLYTAMFDEVDEGTAMFKLAPSASAAPAQGNWVTLDADGTTLPSDWYLRLAGEATKMVRKTLGPTPAIPITP